MVRVVEVLGAAYPTAGPHTHGACGRGVGGGVSHGGAAHTWCVWSRCWGRRIPRRGRTHMVRVVEGLGAAYPTAGPHTHGACGRGVGGGVSHGGAAHTWCVW